MINKLNLQRKVAQFCFEFSIAMAEVSPNLYGQVGQLDHSSDGALGMPQHWVPADDRDAYIGWLKGEFAAANAIIDSMCHHMRTIGGPGEYDIVFSCLHRRRHSWTPSLYMQQFFSVAEIVNSLQQVAWKKHQAHPSTSMANAASKELSTCPSAQAQVMESHKSKSQLGNTHKGLAQLEETQNSTAQLQQTDRSTSQSEEAHNSETQLKTTHQNRARLEETPKSKHSPASSEEVNGDIAENVERETEEAEAPPPPCIAVSKSAEFNMIECNKNAASNKNEDNCAAASICISGNGKDLQREIPRDHPSEQLDDQASPLKNQGSNAKELLSMEISIASKEEDDRVAMIKRSTQFHCCEHVDGQMINNGESVELCESVFSSTEIGNLIEIIHQLQAAGRREELGCTFSSCKTSSGVPDILQFGHKLRNGPGINDIQPIPNFLQAIISWLTRCGILSMSRRPDSCLISIFDKGDFEPPNTDQCAWEKPLCVLSLMGDCTMVFGHSISTDQQGSCKGPFQVALPAGSVLLLQENFAGILQKAIPASPSRRITIAFGKALGTGIVELNSASAQSKTKSKHWGAGEQNRHRRQFPLFSSPSVTNGTFKQAGPIPNPGMIPLHPLPHMPHLIPQHQPLPGTQPLFPNPTGGLMSPYMPHPLMAQGWSSVPRNSRLHNTGTGVFFPSSDQNGGVSVPSWQSGLIVVSSFSQKSGSLLGPSSALEVRRSAHSRRAEKHAGQFSTNQARVKGSLVSVDLITSKSKSGKHLGTATPCQDIDGTGNGETAAK